MVVKQSIEKTPAILQRIDEFLNAPLSASAFNKYMACPLDFYYRYLLELDEDKTIEEEVESATFGTFIHHVLEKLFSPFSRHDKVGNKVIPHPPAVTGKDIDKMLKDVEPFMEDEFLRHFSGDKKAFSQGKNLLSYRMALELTERILKQEKAFVEAQSVPVFIEFLEVEMKAEMEIALNGQSRKVFLKGYMDRIDSIGDKVRIIDYKSGKVNYSDVTLPDFDDSSDWLQLFGNTKHAVQLAMYCFLYRANMGKLPDMAGIFSLVNISQGLFPLNGKTKSVEEIMDVFPLFVKQVLEEIYDESVAFEHQVKGQKSFCIYCD
jgi:RecB family exonuclease